MGGPPIPGLAEQQSILNPADAMQMKNSGQVTPDTTVREFLEQRGVDVEGPVTQLIEAFKGEMQKANPINKMKAMSGGPPGMPPGGPPGMPPGGGPPGGGPPGGGMDQLLKQV
jgi:hypothetical protein